MNDYRMKEVCELKEATSLPVTDTSHLSNEILSIENMLLLTQKAIIKFSTDSSACLRYTSSLRNSRICELVDS
jgi:hypothetical protein